MNLNDNELVFNCDVQQNVEQILNKFGNYFTIIDNNIKLPSILTKHNNIYELKCDVSIRTNANIDYSIIFADYFTLENNNNCYINSIHKSNEFSGTQIVETIIKLLKKINVKKIYVNDGTRIEVIIDHKKIKLDLSLFKLIEKGQTFYQRFGFVPTFGNFKDKILFKNEPDILDKLHKNLQYLYKLKCKDIKHIYDKVIEIIEKDKINNYENILIYKYDRYAHIIEESCYVHEIAKCEDILKNFKELSISLNNDQTFYKLLINAFYNDHKLYYLFENFVLKYGDVIGIEYNNIKTLLSFCFPIIEICFIKNMIFVLNL